MTVFTATPENPTGSSYAKRYTPEIGSLSSANIAVKEVVKQRESQIFLILYNFCQSEIILEMQITKMLWTPMTLPPSRAYGVFIGLHCSLRFLIPFFPELLQKALLHWPWSPFQTLKNLKQVNLTLPWSQRSFSSSCIIMTKRSADTMRLGAVRSLLSLLLGQSKVT